MLKEETKRVIEECLLAAQSVLERSGVSTIAQTDLSKPHSLVILQVFDYTTSKLNNYRHGSGVSPLRNFIRSGSSDAAYFEQIARIVEALRSLQGYFLPFFPDLISKIEPADESYIRRINFENLIPWPDELYYNIRQDFRVGKGLSLGARHELEDLYVDFFKEYGGTPADIAMETNTVGAIELVYLGPWLGFKVEDIERALWRFHEELDVGKADIVSPMAHCLEPKKSWRWRQPLWEGGRLEGVLSVLIGGSLDEIDDLNNGCFEELSQIGDLIRSVLQMEREHYAEAQLDYRYYDDEGSLEEALEEYCQILMAPHEVTSVVVSDPNGTPNTDQITRSDAMTSNGSSTSFQLREQLFGKDVTIDVQLFDEERQHIRDLLKIYLSGELRRVTEPLAETDTLLGDTTTKSEELRPAVMERANQILDQFEGQRLSTKDYCLCFICLAITSKGKEESIRITGNTKNQLQWDLEKTRNITRKNQWTRSGELKRDENGDVVVMPLSQLCDDRAINFVSKQIPELRITRHPRDLVEIEFGNGKP